MNNTIVIIGGGVASVNAMKAIREVDKSSNIHLVSNEPYYPYYRIKLTKVMFGPLDIDKIMLQKPEWYDQNNIQLHLGRDAIAIDTEKHTVTLDNGEELVYDQLLLANGASNNIPQVEGIEKENVFSIRKLTDIEEIKKHIANKNDVLCIGGGIQNLEAAWAIRSQGKNVTIAEFQDRLMPRQLDRKASEILKKAVQDSGIKILLNTEITKINGTGKVHGAVTKDGAPIECDMVIYSVGVKPNIHLYENTPIKINRGVVVDQYMRTSVENIYAAGDVAETSGGMAGLWSIAMEQGKIAGKNMTGMNTSYTNVIPVTNMNAFHLSVFSIGNIDEAGASHTITEEAVDGSSYTRIFIKDHILVGAIVIGNPQNNTLIKKFIDNRMKLPNMDYTHITLEEFITNLRNV